MLINNSHIISESYLFYLRTGTLEYKFSYYGRNFRPATESVVIRVPGIVSRKKRIVRDIFIRLELCSVFRLKTPWFLFTRVEKIRNLPSMSD